MFKRMTLILATLAAAVLLPAAPANAVEAQVLNPVTHEATDAGQHTIIVQAPRDAWGLRKVTRDLDARLDNVVIYERYGVKCNPNVTCIRVTIRNYGWNGLACGEAHYGVLGCSQVGGADPFIQLNKIAKHERMRIAAHEFGHALGLNHHDQYGVLGRGHGRYFSGTEVNVLRPHFHRL